MGFWVTSTASHIISKLRMCYIFAKFPRGTGVWKGQREAIRTLDIILTAGISLGSFIKVQHPLCCLKVCQKKVHKRANTWPGSLGVTSHSLLLKDWWAPRPVHVAVISHSIQLPANHSYVWSLTINNYKRLDMSPVWFTCSPGIYQPFLLLHEKY